MSDLHKILAQEYCINVVCSAVALVKDGDIKLRVCPPTIIVGSPSNAFAEFGATIGGIKEICSINVEYCSACFLAKASRGV